jgi:hypothetical protein
MSSVLFLALMVAFHCRVSSQVVDYPDGYFRSPVDFRMYLSGTFGEIRPDHFHSGIDIKTGGAEGKPIYCMADGYVSRIKISPVGFGKALYITHPNGYVSVYGHLREFAAAINQFIVREQYKRKSFEIDIPLNETLFPVKKGDIIAKSGNTGSSGGPHLHLEIRHAGSQFPINPLLFGLEVKDAIRPRILSMKIYALEPSSLINGKNDSVVFALEGWGPNYQLAGPDTIKLTGRVAFGLQTYDMLDDTDNKNGIYTVDLLLDGQPVWSFSAETFSFGESRYVNSLVDYAENKKSGRRFVRTCIDPGNKLSCYKNVVNSGIIDFNEDRVYRLEYVVKDASGNTSNLVFYVKGNEYPRSADWFSIFDSPDEDVFPFDRVNHFEADGLIVDIPEGSLYDNLHFEYSSSKPLKNTACMVYHIHNAFTPLHQPMELQISMEHVPERLRMKAFMVLIENGEFKYLNSKIEDGLLKGRSSSFGAISIMVDTVNPVIKPVNFYNGKVLTGFTQLKVLALDNESGMDRYTATLNGEWILMEYDAKNDLLIYNFDHLMKKGANVFRLEVTDRRGNMKSYEARLTY